MGGRAWGYQARPLLGSYEERAAMTDVDTDEVGGERWPVVTAIGAVATVAVVAAVVSYMHMREVAEAAGEEWRAILLPLSVDGMIVAATLNAWQAKRRQRRLPAMTLVALVAGLVVSIAANIAAPFLDVLRGQWLSAVVAAWPPIALAISSEELALMLRQSGTRAADVPAVPDVVPERAADVPAVPDVVPERAADVPAVPDVVPERAADVPAVPDVVPERAADVPAVRDVGRGRAADVRAVPDVVPERAADVPAVPDVVPERAADVPAVPDVVPERAADVPDVVPERQGCDQEFAAESGTRAADVPDVVPERAAGNVRLPLAADDRAAGGTEAAHDAARVPEQAAEQTAALPTAPGSGDDREAARELVRQDPDGWTGAQLAERFGRSERWGRAQIAAVRAEQVQARRSSISAVK